MGLDREGLIREFLNGAVKGKSSSLSISGGYLYSYSTKIAKLEGDTVYLNVKKYSMTTSTQQNKVRSEAKGMGLNVVEVDEEEKL